MKKDQHSADLLVAGSPIGVTLPPLNPPTQATGRYDDSQGERAPLSPAELRRLDHAAMVEQFKNLPIDRRGRRPRKAKYTMQTHFLNLHQLALFKLIQSMITDGDPLTRDAITTRAVSRGLPSPGAADWTFLDGVCADVGVELEPQAVTTTTTT